MLRGCVWTILQLEMEFDRAPVLFNLYFCDMVDDWRRQCLQAGVAFCHCHGYKIRRSYSQVTSATILNYRV